MAEIPDRVPGGVILASYANDIRDRTAQRYADPTARDASNPLPSEGELAYIASLDQLQLFTAGLWRDLARGDEYLALAGGTMLGPISMNNQKITNLAAGTAAADAVRKDQVDAADQALDARVTVLEDLVALEYPLQGDSKGFSSSGEANVGPITVGAGDWIVHLQTQVQWTQGASTSARVFIRLYANDVLQRTWELGSAENTGSHVNELQFSADFPQPGLAADTDIRFEVDTNTSLVTGAAATQWWLYAQRVKAGLVTIATP